MDPSYNSHILRWKNVRWQADERRLLESIRNCKGREVLARIRQSDKALEIRDPARKLREGLKQNGFDLSATFDLEVITRQPEQPSSHQPPRAQGKHSPLSPDEFIDRNDFNTLQWNGERGTGMAVTSRVRNTPMFFRSNGMNADLVDLYAGQTLFLVLNGGSLANFDWSRLKKPGICTMGVNNGAHAFRPNFWTSVDDPTRFMRSIWADPTITKIIPMSHFEKPIWDVGEDRLSEWRVKDFPSVFGYRRNEAFQAGQWLHEDTVNWGNHSKRGGGRSVMLAALRIAFLLGFRKVCLLGCDFHMDEKNRYWFAEDRTNHAINNNLNSYRILSGFFEELQPHFIASGFRVFNCNPESQLKAFPQADLEAELRLAAVDVSATTEGMYVDRYKAQKQAVQKQQAQRAGLPPKKAVSPAPAALVQPKTLHVPVTQGPVDQMEMLGHLVNALRRSPVRHSPFAHLEIRNAFSDAICGALVEHLPDEGHYQARLPDTACSGDKHGGLRFGFSGQEMKSLINGQQAVWSAVRTVMLSRQLEHAFRTVFRDSLRERFGKDFNSLALQPKLELVRTQAGSAAAHCTEISQKAIAVQFNLPAKANGKQAPGDVCATAAGLEILPGSGHAFVVNKRKSPVADATTGSAGACRDVLMLSYFIK